MPNTWMVMGFESLNGSERSFRFFFENRDSLGVLSVLIAVRWLGFVT